MLNDDGTVLGEVSGLTVARSDDGWYVEVNGVVRGVECFGLEDARFTARVPIEPGWALVKLSEWQKRGDQG